jgi:hypothetical protein
MRSYWRCFRSWNCSDCLAFVPFGGEVAVVVAVDGGGVLLG